MKTIFTQKVENDAMSLMTDGQAENAPVERNADGLLTGFRIMKFGPLSVTKGGKDGTVAMSGEFGADHADIIVANFAKKGAKIPLDCNHMLYSLAKKANTDEAEIAKVTGKESLALSYGELEKRDDGLWIKNLDFNALGKEIVTSKVFRYHSPVIRGMLDNNLRVTSVSLCETPAIDQLDAIAAAETDMPAEGAVASDAGKDGKSAEAAVLARICSILGLDAGTAPDAIYSTLEGIVKRMAEAGAASQAADEVAATEETNKVQLLFTQGLESGQITKAMKEDKEWAGKQTSVSLAAYLKVAPVFVKIGKSDAAKNATVPDETALTAEENEYCEKHGYKKDAFLKAKKEKK